MPPEETIPAPAPSPALAGLAAAMPIAALFGGCGLTGLVFTVGGLRPDEAGVVGWAPLVVFVFAGLVLAPLMYFLARGRAIPTALVLGVAASPWVVGLLGASFTAFGVSGAMARADAAMRSMWLAQAITEILAASAAGAVSGGALLVAAALGLGLASLAQRAPGRALWAGALGFGITMPLVAVAGYGLVSREYFVLVAVFAAFLVALSVALGVAGAGRDERGRSGALAGAVPWVGSLGVAAFVSAALQRSTVVVFTALAAAPGDGLELMVQVASELEPMTAARWLVPLTAILAGLGVAAWAAVRRRPGVLHAVGAAVLFAGFMSVLGLDALTRWQVATAVPERESSAPDGFEPAIDSDALGDAGEPDLYVGSAAVRSADGAFTAPLDAASLVAAFQRQRRPVPEAEVWLDAAPELVVALDRRVTGDVLRRLVVAAGQAGVRAFALSGYGPAPPTDAQRETLRSAVPALWMAVSPSRGLSALTVLVPGPDQGESASYDRSFLHVTLRAAVPGELEARAAVPSSRRQLLGRGWASDNQPAPAWVAVTSEASPASLLALVGRLRERSLAPVLVDALPDATPRGLGLARMAERLAELRSDGPGTGVIGGLGGGDGSAGVLGGTVREAPRGDGYGNRPARVGNVPRVRLDRPTVRGSLSAEVVRRVQRRHLSEVRFCYERHLMQHPGAAGDIELSYVISPEGRVTRPTASSDALPEVAACVGRVVLRWTFPSPEGGGIVMVNQRIVLEAG